MMKHFDESRMADFEEKRLSLLEAFAFRIHASFCPSCRKAFEFYRSQRDFLKDFRSGYRAMEDAQTDVRALFDREEVRTK